MEKICKNCGATDTKTVFYLGDNHLCKDCARKLVDSCRTNKERVLTIEYICRKYNFKYIHKLASLIVDTKEKNFFGYYMKNLNSLKHYSKALNEARSLIVIEKDLANERVNILKEKLEIYSKEKDENSADDVQFLIIEKENLKKKINKALEEDNIGTYKNLIQAFENVVKMIENMEWKKEYSVYTSSFDGKEEKCVSIWEQKGQEVRNSRAFVIQEELNQKVEEIYINALDADRDGGIITFMYKNGFISVSKPTKKELIDEALRTIDEIQLELKECKLVIKISYYSASLGMLFGDMLIGKGYEVSRIKRKQFKGEEVK
ncbi:MAG: hypothetical protein ACLTDM_04305 [Clostridium butyricum]